MFTQVTSMILAFTLGIVTLLHISNQWQILVLAFLLGTIDSIDKPARQAFIVELVGKKHLSSAIALNSGIFNSARVIGPAVAGIILGLSSASMAFILNGISFIPVIIALLFVKPLATLPQVHPHPLKAMKEGLGYGFSHSLIRTLLILTAVTAIFGWSFTTIIPVVVQDVYHFNESGLWYFYLASGVGALFGMLFVSSKAKRQNALAFIQWGNLLFAGTLLLFTLTTNLPLALFFLFLGGFGITMQFSTVNTTIQHLVPDNIRGRIMSIYVLMFIGMTPLGNYQIGLVSEHLGVLTALRIGAIVLLLAQILLFFILRGKKADE